MLATKIDILEPIDRKGRNVYAGNFNEFIAPACGIIGFENIVFSGFSLFYYVDTGVF